MLFRLFLLVLFTPLAFLPAQPGIVPAAPKADGILRVRVTNVQTAAGKIWVGIYTSEQDFLDRDKARLVYAEVNAAVDVEIPIDGLRPGQEYALGIFHDVNDNGELDLNWLGLPCEPWAFSGPVRTRLRLPRFSEVSFTYLAGSDEQILTLRQW